MIAEVIVDITHSEVDKVFDYNIGNLSVDLGYRVSVPFGNRKIEGIALWVKNLDAEAKAYKEEKDSFAQKQKVAENKAKSLKEFLSHYLDGTAFKSTKVNVSFRSSKAVDVFNMDELMNYDDCDSYLKYAEPTPDKTAIKNAINSGVKIPGCRIVENSNIQIK